MTTETTLVKSDASIEEFEWNGLMLNISFSTEADRTTTRSKNGNEDVVDDIPTAYSVTAAFAIDEDGGESEVTASFLKDTVAVTAAIVEANRQIQRRY